MSEEKGYYKITRIVEITSYVLARNERVGLAINYQHSHSGWDGEAQIVSEKIERAEEEPTYEQLHTLHVEIPCPCVKAIVMLRGKTETIWIPVLLVEEDGLESAIHFIHGERAEVISCNTEEYYRNQSDELWQPVSAGGKL